MTSATLSTGPGIQPRPVPISPDLVQLLREHLDRFGTAPDGRLFSGRRGSILSERNLWPDLAASTGGDTHRRTAGIAACGPALRPAAQWGHPRPERGHPGARSGQARRAQRRGPAARLCRMHRRARAALERPCRRGTQRRGCAVTAFRRGYADSRKRPGVTGNHRARKARARNRICAGHGPCGLVVAGAGFEPA